MVTFAVRWTREFWDSISRHWPEQLRCDVTQLALCGDELRSHVQCNRRFRVLLDDDLTVKYAPQWPCALFWWKGFWDTRVFWSVCYQRKYPNNCPLVSFCPFVTKNSIKNRLKTTDRLKTPLFTLGYRSGGAQAMAIGEALHFFCNDTILA